VSGRPALIGCVALLLGFTSPEAARAAGAAAAETAPAPAYYTAADFQRVDKIDAHLHLHGRADRFMAQASADRFRVLTINVEDPDFPPIAEQQREAVSLRERYPGWVAFAATFSTEGFQAPGWSESAVRHIDAARAQGAVGVKIWKNIGMVLRNPTAATSCRTIRGSRQSSRTSSANPSCFSDTRRSCATAGCRSTR